MPGQLVKMPARVLIADDSSSFRSVLKKLIESRSSRCKVCGEASDGVEAVQKSVELKPDLAIIDLQMPLMDGLTASARIAKSLPGIPILICTIHKSDYLDSEARKAGIREVVSKSNIERLLNKMEDLLGGADPRLPVH
jgi:DNA-binding NarL/FixJ family response regulator